MQSFAPWSYYLKAVFIWGTAIGIEVYMHYFAYYKWWLAAICGWFFALIGLLINSHSLSINAFQLGLNIQHDANHGALSKNPLVNRFWGLSNNWIGASAVSWVHQVIAAFN